ncbi:uncharacterized protein K460DRAFT_365321 [Cucurbitaria berberidis CBS 394.84]|uniref:Uncharacterized protein n=1 Tax=Cucurbitaria berberidis CBS 394.84 TaxID=1168544 RepID=A0A9P4LCR9_9PLEO|nr:uncharacterized protein K460DRAFT_365321 [Cucurbitaria berberidis CBS 394.84]KAF1849439.1 hypothetical protein K460DRAFT_365321 [Cucurbitaria berberidis CBS 394.84]
MPNKGLEERRRRTTFCFNTCTSLKTTRSNNNIMERQERELGQRKSTAFNPEATAFSPIHPTAISKGKESILYATTTPPAIPRELFKTSTVLKREFLNLAIGRKCTQYGTDDSPLRPAEKMRPFYHGEATTSSVPVVLGDLLQRTQPGQQPSSTSVTLLTKVSENYLDSSEGTAGTPLQQYNLSKNIVSLTGTQVSPYLFSSPRPEPKLGAVDVDELSASLGLPGVRKNVMRNDSPAHSQKSCPSQGPPDYLVGKLIGKALDTPLTAHALARYLNTSEIVSSDDTTAASRELQESVMGSGMLSRNDSQATKIVRPPPGFRGEASRRIAIEDPISVVPAVTEPKYGSTGPDVLLQAPRHNPFQPTNHIQHQARRSSSRRRPRAYTRVRRTDQGPEPSAADIYPDDANWEPFPIPFNGRERVPNRPSFVPQLPLQRVIQVNDTIGWPTPAEVYTQPTPSGVNMHKSDAPPRSPTINIFENHVPPTGTDINAADDEVLAIIDELPDPSATTLLRLGSFDLGCDERPLTPGQYDASRYGMEYHGLALGDTWNCPPAEETEPFRVRPRNHEGWGGWEWALRSGWGDK